MSKIFRSGQMALKFEKRQQKSRLAMVLIPVLSIFLALAVGALFIMSTGYHPIAVYRVMFNGAFGSAYALSETVVVAIPLTILSVGVSIAFKAKLMNIGAEGQLYIGAWGASSVALFMSDIPNLLVIPLMIIFGMIAGGIWALIPAIPRAYLGVNEVITTLLLNYVAMHWVTHFVYGPWQNPATPGFPRSAPFPDFAILPKLFGTRIHYGLYIALAVAAIGFFVLKKSKWGFEVRTVGENPVAAKYAGINIKRKIISVMVVSGAMAGLAGMIEVSGMIFRLQEQISPDYGYTAIIIAWLAKLNPLACIIVSFLFGGLINSGFTIQAFGLPGATSLMIQGLILFFVLGGDVFYNYKLKLFRSQTETE